MKKIIILILLFTVTCCLFLVPTSNVSASENYDTRIDNTGVIDTSLGRYLIFDLNGLINNEAFSGSISTGDGYCQLDFYYIDGFLEFPSHSCYYYEMECIDCLGYVNDPTLKIAYIYFYRIDYYTLNLDNDYVNVYLSIDNVLDIDDNNTNNFDESLYLDSLYTDLYHKFFDVSDDVYSPEYFYNLSLAEKREALLYAYDKIWELGEIYGKDTGYDKGSSDGYTDGFNKGYNAGVKDGITSEKLNQLKLEFGPLYNSTMQGWFDGLILGKSSIFDFNTEYDDFTVDSYLNLRYFFNFCYEELNGAFPDSSNYKDGFNLFIVFGEELLLKDVYLHVQGIDNIVFTIKGNRTFSYSIPDYVDPLQLDFSRVDLTDRQQNQKIDGVILHIPDYAVLEDYSFGFIFDDFYRDYYNSGYAAGYEYGYESGMDNCADNLHENIEKNAFNNGYDNGYNVGYGKGYSENNFTLTNLFWIIAGLPFESFKGIWSVEFLGVNIAGFVCGLLMFAVCLYIIKKVIK